MSGDIKSTRTARFVHDFYCFRCATFCLLL